MVVGEELTERRRRRKIFCVCGKPYVEDGGATKSDSPAVGLGRPITSEDQLMSFMCSYTLLPKFVDQEHVSWHNRLKTSSKRHSGGLYRYQGLHSLGLQPERECTNKLLNCAKGLLFPI
jgi:hypothetical protein